MFYDWNECVMSVLGTTKTYLVQLYSHLAIKLYCIVLHKVVMYTETNGQGLDLRQRKTQQLGTENMTDLLFKK